MLTLPQGDPLYTALETLSYTIYFASTNAPDLLPIVLKIFYQIQLLTQAFLSHHPSLYTVSNHSQETALSNPNTPTSSPTQLPSSTVTLIQCIILRFLKIYHLHLPIKPIPPQTHLSTKSKTTQS
eukprot:Phypoly_transcript_17600.p2 GENE.Phypoly_transcript_17600~~Phypoly_transcript_17600.p2  ORF type:complete len:125 (-),score=11.26 Phypoly_transcript_17600:80-454(-)